MKPTKTLVESRKETDSDENVVVSVEFVIRTELQGSVETDFVHSILGRITAEPESRGKEDAGHFGASPVQFSEALDHGISAERLGDSISGKILEYWEHLFDVETGYPKEEIQNEFEVVDLDTSLSPSFRETRRYRRHPPAGTIWTIILLNPTRAPYDQAATPALGNERPQRFPNRTGEGRSPGRGATGSGSRHRLRAG